MIRAIVIICAALAAGAVFAENYPNKPIRMIVAVPPGGPADTLARLVGPRLGEALGQTVVIDNRPGANGIIAYDMAARSTPDGYTFVLVAAGVAINPSLYHNVQYDPVKDFSPITLGITVPNILVVHPSVPATSVQELIALAKAKPGQARVCVCRQRHFRASCAGTVPPVLRHQCRARALQRRRSGADRRDRRSGPGAVQHCARGHAASEGGQGTRAGHHQRHPFAGGARSADVAESGFPGFEVIGWFGWLAPAKAPKEVVNRLNREIVRILNMSAVHDRLLSLSTVPVGDTPAQFAGFIRSERDKWAKVIRTAGIKLE